jgi:hypothetical protein
VQGPLAPGAVRKPRAPLPTASLVVGLALCALAVLMGLLRPLARELASDPLVVRALGATIWVAGLMLGRVALVASAGVRRAVGLLLGTALLFGGSALILSPAIAASVYQKPVSALAPWWLGVPGVLCLLLSRWRVRSN